jgi:hypothetical protein
MDCHQLILPDLFGPPIDIYWRMLVFHEGATTRFTSEYDKIFSRFLFASGTELAVDNETDKWWGGNGKALECRHTPPLPRRNNRLGEHQNSRSARGKEEAPRTA